MDPVRPPLDVNPMPIREADCNCAGGTPLPRPARLYWDTAVIPLTQGKVALVDLVDADLAEHLWFAWKARRTFYAGRRSGDGPQQSLHQAIAERAGLVVPGQIIDHRDGDGLNCSRSNLRPATYEENSRNQRLRADSTSGARGVSWNSQCQKWRATIRVSGRLLSLGLYATVDEAAAAYAAAAKEHHRDFARTDREQGAA